MVAAAEEPDRYAKERVEWAGERTWARRTDAWLAGTLGDRLASSPCVEYPYTEGGTSFPT
jgi:hypothetical protein